MKVLVGSSILAIAAFAAYGQETRPAPFTPPAAPPLTATAPAIPASPLDAKVIAELAATYSQMGGVKNSPFSADEVNESVQVLADGNRITHSSTNKVYRNGEGRMRRDMQGGVLGGVMGTTFTVGGGVSIVDPGRQQILLDKEAQVARIAELNATTQALTIVNSAPRVATEEERARALQKLSESGQTLVAAKQDLERAQEALTAVAARAPVAVVTGQASPVVVDSGSGFYYSTGTASKYDTRSEELGTRDFNGVSAEGRRTITTIPAGAIGNDRPIEITYERWYSKDLGMVVYSKRSDPRTGEQTYELKNIVRAEPDPSLFTIPKTYTKVSTTGTVYRPAQPVAAAGAAKKRPQQN